MKAKLLLAVFLIGVLCTSLLPILAPITTLAAGEDWLTGYDYRYAFNITNTTAGAQTNYTMRLEIYNDTIQRFGYEYMSTFAIGANDTHAQGIASDGEYIYFTGSENSTGVWLGQLWKYDKAGNLIANVTSPELEGTNMTQVNGIYVHTDGNLYIGSNNYNNATKRGYIKVFNKTDLSYVEEHRVADQHCEGAAYWNGSWWAVYSNWKNITEYNLTWDLQATHFTNVHAQGIDWLPDDQKDYYYTPYHQATTRFLWVGYWNGTGFVKIQTIDVPLGTSTGQGIGFEPSTNILWWANRVESPKKAWAVQTRFAGSISVGTDCQGDFDDVRFTRADGITELDYWMESYTTDTNATFWVEFNAINTTGNTPYYMYYGNATVATTSSGDDAFIDFFDKDSTTGWSKSDITVSTSGDYLHFYNPTAGDSGWAEHSLTSTPTSFMMEACVKNIGLGTTDQCIICLEDGSAANYFSRTYSPSGSSHQSAIRYYVGTYYTLDTWTEGTESIIKHFVNEANSTTGIHLYSHNLTRNVQGQVVESAFAIGSPTDCDKIGIGDASGSANCSFWVKWLFIRNCVTQEPTWGEWGSRESEPPAPPEPTPADETLIYLLTAAFVMLGLVVTFSLFTKNFMQAIIALIITGVGAVILLQVLTKLVG